jgi:hypothetical protein
VPQTKSFSVGHLGEDRKLINLMSSTNDVNSTLPVATFRALCAFTSLWVFFDCVDVSLRARFLLHFTGTHVDDSIGTAYGLVLDTCWWTWSWAVWWNRFTFSVICCNDSRLGFCEYVTKNKLRKKFLENFSFLFFFLILHPIRISGFPSQHSKAFSPFYLTMNQQTLIDIETLKRFRLRKNIFFF